MSVKTQVVKLDEPQQVTNQLGQDINLVTGWVGECECGFLSSGWPTKKVAEARLSQHSDEHESGEAMPDLDAFRAEHELAVTDSGEVVFATSALKGD